VLSDRQVSTQSSRSGPLPWTRGFFPISIANSIGLDVLADLNEAISVSSASPWATYDEG
jgi:hypothetical protein